MATKSFTRQIIIHDSKLLGDLKVNQLSEKATKLETTVDNINQVIEESSKIFFTNLINNRKK